MIGFALRMAQQSQIALLADLDRAERGQMRRDELAIEQFDPAQPQRHHQPAQRHLARFAHPAEHAFAAKDPVKADAIEPAHQPLLARLILQPAFHGMRVAQGVQLVIGRRDAMADPCLA